MNLLVALTFTGLAVWPLYVSAEEPVVFRDDFRGRLQPGWSWIREVPADWRVSDRGLEVRILPGNMWGPANNATNVLVRSLPDPGGQTLELAVTVENEPTEQYEQMDLVCFFDESHMVKIGQEKVDGKLCIVMGREENDRTRTIAIIPIAEKRVRVRFLLDDTQVRGEYRLDPNQKWVLAGVCDAPVKGEPKVSLQVYQGPRNQERWGIFSEFVVRTLPSP